MKIQKPLANLTQLTNLLKQTLFAPGAHSPRRPAMRGAPLPPEHGQKIRAARARQMRRAADRRQF